MTNDYNIIIEWEGGLFPCSIDKSFDEDSHGWIELY